MRDLYRETFDEIHASEALRQEVLNMTKQERAVVKRQIPRMLLIAAVIVLVLAGTTLAVSLTGLPDWFGRQWTEETGKVIEKDQMGVITGLTDEVGVSAKAGDVTVTVDSVTRGESAMWMLMKVEGGVPPETELEARMRQYERPIEGLPEGITPPSNRYYEWIDLDLVLTPEGTEQGPAWRSYSPLQETRGEDGSLTLLMRFQMPAESEHTLLEAGKAALTLGGLQWGSFTGKVPIADGPWALEFTLPAIEPAKPLTTGKCRVLCDIQPEGAWSLAEDGPLPTKEVEFEDIQVMSTGVRFLWTDPQQMKEARFPGFIKVVMKDGTEARTQGGSGYVSRADGQVISQVTQYLWPVPVDLSQVESLEIGEQTLALK